MRWTQALLRIVLIGAAAAVAAPVATATAGPDSGFTVRWDTVAKKDRAAAASLRASGLVDVLAERLNARLVVPQPVTLRIGRSVIAGPFVERPPVYGRYAGVMPATWLTWVHARLGPKLALWKALPALRRLGPRRVTDLAAAAFLAHEAGHALITMFDLPITGREEDAADGFAIRLLLSEPGFGADAALAMVGSLAPFAAITRLDALAFSDSHELPQQRMVQMLCWVYGSDPARFAGLIGNRLLPGSRSPLCVREWSQLQHAWDVLLAPHAHQAPAGTVPARDAAA